MTTESYTVSSVSARRLRAFAAQTSMTKSELLSRLLKNISPADFRALVSDPAGPALPELVEATEDLPVRAPRASTRARWMKDAQADE